MEGYVRIYKALYREKNQHLVGLQHRTRLREAAWKPGDRKQSIKYIFSLPPDFQKAQA